MNPEHNKKKISKLRIIAGQWRGRSLSFAQAPGLRPTGDRVRETLFNWLQNDIVKSRCLDLFAGSGALGFEAASRGAQYVLMVESNSEVVSSLRQQQRLLNASTVEVRQSTAQQYLAEFGLQKSELQKSDLQSSGLQKTGLQKTGRQVQPFDIVFVDPPFRDSINRQVLDELLRSGTLRNGGLIYLESASDPAAEQCMPEALTVLRSKTTGSVQYQLLRLAVNKL